MLACHAYYAFKVNLFLCSKIFSTQTFSIMLKHDRNIRYDPRWWLKEFRENENTFCAAGEG